MKKVEEVSAVTHENSSSTEEVAATAQGLSAIAIDLLEMANRFKI